MHSAARPRGSMGSSDYDKIGPATVLIDDGNGGSGSGVIISKDGFVLTNYHVVAGGTLEKLHLKVRVQLGKLAPPEGEQATHDTDGTTNLVMTKSDDWLTAYVHAFDPVNDVAIIKIVPPAGATLALTPLPIAKNEAPIGSTVHCMGHPGIGGLWTLREGKVEAVRDDVDLLVRSLGDERKELVDQVRDYQNAYGTGRLLQVSCPFVHGESGGPEVNAAGEIVGINDRYDIDDSGHTRFGVPASAIRKLAASVSATPIDVIPDPWRDGGQVGEISDASLDGVDETLLIKGFTFVGNQVRQSGSALIVDVGQKSFSGASPGVRAVREKRSLQPRFAVVKDGISERTYATYDVDGDGKRDVLIVDTGEEVVGFELENGVARPNDALGRSLFNPRIFTNAAERDRFASVLTSLKLSNQPSTAPLDPLRGGGTPTSLSDRDRNGKADVIWTSGPYSSGGAVDGSEAFLGKFQVGLEDAPHVPMTEGAFDFALVTDNGSRTFAYTATKTTGVLDLGMRIDALPAGTVQSVWMLDGSAAPKDMIGRKLVRPGVVTAAAWDRVKLGWPRMLVADDDGVASFPSVAEDVVNVERFSKKGFEKKILVAEGRVTDAIFVDVDASTWRGANASASPTDLVHDGKVRAKLVIVGRGGHAWALYDTDNDGKVDVVLYAADAGSIETSAGYRIDKAGKVTVDPALASGALVRTSLFKGALAGKMKHLISGSKLFEDGDWQ